MSLIRAYGVLARREIAGNAGSRWPSLARPFLRGMCSSMDLNISAQLRRRAPPNFGIVVVPEQMNFIVERFGRFHRTLSPGLQLLIPLVDQITYVHSLKEEAISIPNQMAITRDNVTLSIDGVLYVKVRLEPPQRKGDPHPPNTGIR